MRVPRTFVFVDLSGFTNYTAEHGDERAGELLAAFRACIRDVASERGVRIAKWLGDGCMIVSVDQVDAIGAALDLRHEVSEACAPLAVRVGVASGRALLFEGDDYIGRAVNLAARLCDVAHRFEVLLPAECAVGLPEGVTATPLGPVTLAGFPQVVEVVGLNGRAPRSTRGDTGELWTRTPFVA